MTHSECLGYSWTRYLVRYKVHEKKLSKVRYKLKRNVNALTSINEKYIKTK